MVRTEALHRLVKDEGILLGYQALPGGLDGMFHIYDGTSAIVIDEGIVMKERQYRTVLAEEIGHHFTCNWDSVSRRKGSTGGKIKYEKAEMKAHRWAADYMIPTDQLLAAMNRMEPISLARLAERFCVEESLVRNKLEVMAAIRHTWRLDDGRKLVLTNLPDVYLYEAL